MDEWVKGLTNEGYWGLVAWLLLAAISPKYTIMILSIALIGVVMALRFG